MAACFLRDRNGAVALEFALLTPFLALLTIGLVNFGEAVNRKLELSSAMRAALNAAITSPFAGGNTSGISDAFTYAAPAAPAGARTINVRSFCECASGAAVSCSDVCSSGEPLQLVSIEIREEFELAIPLPIFGNSVTLEESAITRVF